VLCLAAVELAQSKIRLRERLNLQRAFVRWSFYAASVTALVLLADFAASQEFIYFQF
jgi:hypothetical protein